MQTVSFEEVVRSYEGDISEDMRPWVNQKIQEATRLLYAKCPVAEKLAESGNRLVDDVIIRAVLRVVRDDSPLYKSESEDGYSYTKNSLTASGDIWFPDADLSALRGVPTARRFSSSKVRHDGLFANTRRRWR